MRENNNLETTIKKLIVAVLDDEYGVSTTAYGLICDVVHELGVPSLIRNVEATDGRFYFPEDAVPDVTDDQ